MPRRSHAAPLASRSSRTGVALSWVLMLGVVGSVDAAEKLSEQPEAMDEPLVPIPTLLRPMGKSRTAQPPPSNCEAAPLPQLPEDLPFGPGEKLDYDVSLMGVRTGRVTLSMEDRENLDGLPVYPVKAYGRTEGMANMLGGVDVRLVSYLDPGRMTPVRAADRSRVDPPIGEEVVIRGDAAFSGKGQVAGHLKWWRDEKGNQSFDRREVTSDLVDVLGVVYYARSRVYEEGSAFCFEVYYRRRIFRVEGTFGGVEVVRSPFGTREARKIHAVIRRMTTGKPTDDARSVDIWVSNDGQRLPLIVRTEDGIATIEAALRVASPGRRLQRRVAAR